MFGERMRLCWFDVLPHGGLVAPSQLCSRQGALWKLTTQKTLRFRHWTEDVRLTVHLG